MRCPTQYPRLSQFVCPIGAVVDAFDFKQDTLGWMLGWTCGERPFCRGDSAALSSLRCKYLEGQGTGDARSVFQVARPATDPLLKNLFFPPP